MNITQITGGRKFTIFLTSDGSVYGFGLNDNGQLGLGNTTSPQSTPQEITHFNGTTITHVACGEEYTIFFRKRC